MKNLQTFEEFLNESNHNLITFSIDDEKLDQILHDFHERELDYVDDKGDSLYTLPKKEFDRFINYADNKGFDVDYKNSEDSVIFIKESHYAFLGGNSNFTDEEMRKNVVDKILGKKYDSYIMFNEPKGVYDKMKSQYTSGSDNWEYIWRSTSNQSYALLSPDKKVIKAAIFSDGGIVGAIYVKK